ncbi:hypothetical protein PMAYCL1PPCAC_14840, partial [Pristionchus mayeri]
LLIVFLISAPRYMIVLSIHLPLLAFGFFMGLTLLLAIVRATPRAVKNYSVLLLWGAVNDLLSVTVDLISMERLTAIWPVFIYIPSGPCAKISVELCNLCNSLFLTLVANSMIFQCISFWYRLRVLSKPPPGTLALNAIIVICLIPNIIEITYTQIKRNLFGDPAFLQTVQTLYPLHNWTGVPFYGKS